MTYGVLDKAPTPRTRSRQTFMATGCTIPPWQRCSLGIQSVNPTGAAASRSETIPVTINLTITNLSCAGNATLGSTHCVLMYWFVYTGQNVQDPNVTVEFTVDSLHVSFPALADSAVLVVEWLCQYYPYSGGSRGPYFNVSAEVETP
jgi:hypothetical protein